MFYYLLYNSSFSFIEESRLFSTILYGSILYILTHAILNYCDISILNIINNYYWTVLSLDIISFFYALYQSFTNTNISSQSQNDLNVSFNLLKNKINSFVDRKSDLTITHTKNNSNSNNNNLQNSNSQNKNSYNSNQTIKIIDDDIATINTTSTSTSNKFSTPISHLQNIKTNNNNKVSTPISIIRNNINIMEPSIDEQDLQEGLDNQYAESNTGSDLGSVMDLADFETSL